MIKLKDARNDSFLIKKIIGESNSAKQSLKFIRDVQQSIIENPGIVGLPGFFQQFTQSVGSTAFDIMDALKAKGALDSKSYDKNVNRIQNSVISHLKENYVKYNQTGDKNANNFSTDRANGTDEPSNSGNQRVAVCQWTDPHRPFGGIHSNRHLGPLSKTAGKPMHLYLW